MGLTKLCARCGETKLRTDFHLRGARWIRTNCKACTNVENAARNKKNKEGIAEASRRWRSAHPDTAKLTARKWQSENRLHVAANYRAYRLRTLPEHAMRSAQRRTGLARAIPAWANRFFIEEIYRLAAMRTEMLGLSFHVDHIVPLKHPLVCGLHNEFNLRVIPATGNISKGNRFWPGMP